MGDPSNRNQAHLVKGGRSTSRVLAPPGGRSSLSLGGYGGPSDFPRSTYGNAPAPAAASYYKAPTVAPAAYASERESRAVPGLENHYRRAGGSTTGGGGGAADIGGGSSIGFYDAGAGARRGPLAGDDYAAQLREQIAMKKQIDADANDHYDRRVSLRRSAADDASYGSALAVSADRQAVLRRAADARHDEAMHAYRARQESSRERDYRKMQNAEDDDDRRHQHQQHHRATTKSVRDVAAEREQENRRFNSVNTSSSRRDSFGGGGMAATLRGDASDDGASYSTKRRFGGNNDGRRRDSFSIGWE